MKRPCPNLFDRLKDLEWSRLYPYQRAFRQVAQAQMYRAALRGRRLRRAVTDYAYGTANTTKETESVK